VAIDGVPLPEPHKTDLESYSSEVYYMPKADYWIPAVSAASMVAKVARDRWMVEAGKKYYPGYDFEHNVGYHAPKHVEGLKKLGMCAIHRRSFVPQEFHHARMV
jgi:ribonuclease HII